MDAVLLVERGIPGDAVEEKWNERHVIRVCDLAIDRTELARILLAEIRRRLDAEEQHASVPRLRTFDDRREIRAKLRRGEPAQAVVPAERHDEHAHVALHRPVEPPKASRRRV